MNIYLNIVVICVSLYFYVRSVFLRVPVWIINILIIVVLIYSGTIYTLMLIDLIPNISGDTVWLRPVLPVLILSMGLKEWSRQSCQHGKP